MSDEVVVMANDVVPGMGLPVAAPGLRAAGIAAGLRLLGHAVTVVVDSHVLRKASPRPVPSPRPPGVIILSARQAGDLVRTRRPRAVVLTNSNHFEAIGEVGPTARVFDFFAPKVLELEQQPDGDRDAALAALRARKLAALGQCDAVVINGEKKVDYVAGWLTRAGRTPRDVPTVQLPTPLDLTTCAAPAQGPLHVTVGGYLQPWSRPAAWVEDVRPLLLDGSLVLHLMVATHWGGGGLQALPASFAELASARGVVRHGLAEYGDFRRVVSSCHVSVDVFERNPERELAMVTRTLVALSCGVPVIHVPFTETGPLIERHGAGWLVDDADVGAVARLLRAAMADRGLLERGRAGAESLGRETLRPDVATRGLHELLGRLS